jgi:hypothetical protein
MMHIQRSEISQSFDSAPVPLRISSLTLSPWHAAYDHHKEKGMINLLEQMLNRRRLLQGAAGLGVAGMAGGLHLPSAHA